MKLHPFMCKTFFLLFILGVLSYTSVKAQDYEAIKRKIASKKITLKTKYLTTRNHIEKKMLLEESKKVMTSNIIDEIIPFWIGTKWTFEGHTEVPNEGSIACGYFVSTTLNHAGFKLNRFKMAQKKPEDEAKIIQLNTKVELLSDITIDQLKIHFQKKKEGLYFIGLDYHVGYILKENEKLFFIHSNYINLEGVIKEEIGMSKAILSKKYFIADITNNNELVKKWLLSEIIKT